MRSGASWASWGAKPQMIYLESLQFSLTPRFPGPWGPKNLANIPRVEVSLQYHANYVLQNLPNQSLKRHWEIEGYVSSAGLEAA